MSSNKTKIELLRKDSKGVEGTIANAKHHAEVMLPFIKAMKDTVEHMGFAKWVAGHNVHEFHTHDERRFTLRPFVRNGDYAGVRLSLRLSRSAEVRMVDIDSVADVPRLLDTMRMLASPQLGDNSRLMNRAA